VSAICVRTTRARAGCTRALLALGVAVGAGRHRVPIDVDAASTRAAKAARKTRVAIGHAEMHHHLEHLTKDLVDNCFEFFDLGVHGDAQLVHSVARSVKVAANPRPLGNGDFGVSADVVVSAPSAQQVIERLLYGKVEHQGNLVGQCPQRPAARQLCQLTIPCAADLASGHIRGLSYDPTMSETSTERSVLRVGCAMWAHRPWVGRWFPTSTRTGTELGLYARLCNAVEGNTTFYAEPAATTVARWCEQAPADFRFAFKLPRTVTHDRRLQDVAEPVRSFLNAITPLGERVGPVQAQLPPGFGPEGIEVLLRFVHRLPSDWPWAIELRHAGWFDGGDAQRRLDEVLIEREITRVILDTRPLYQAPAASPAAVEERANKPRLPVQIEAAGPHPIVRVIGHDDPDLTMSGLAAWADQVATWIDEKREPYVFAHQPENLDSPALARAFYDLVRKLRPQLEPLSEPLNVEAPSQSSLFDP